MSDDTQVKIIVRAEPTETQLAEWICDYVNSQLNTRVSFTYFDITKWLRKHYPEFNIVHDGVKQLAQQVVEIFMENDMLKRGSSQREGHKVNEFTPVLSNNFPAFPVKSA